MLNQAQGQCIVHATSQGKFIIASRDSGNSYRLTVRMGTVAGAGRTNKPFVKAGHKFHAMKARGIKYPIVRGKAMNATDHPHGGTHNRNSRGGGKYSTTRPRNLPPGKKVGAIAARRTGKKK